MTRWTRIIGGWGLLAAAAIIAGCSGDRLTWFDQHTTQGIAAADGTLIRNYDVALMQAYDTINALCIDQHWTVKDRDSSSYAAEIDAETDRGIPIEFNIWAKPGNPTSIGIDRPDGRVEEIKTFALLEAKLPGRWLAPGTK